MLKIWKRSARRAFPYKIAGPPVPIVSDAAIATDAVGDGRFVPLVILDTSNRPDIAEIIELQDKVPPGDVVSGWGPILDGPKDHLALFLCFQRPMELSAAVNFDLSRQGSVIELALRARAIYLQAGKPGDRLYATMEAPRMIAELGGIVPPKDWNELWIGAVKNRLRAEGFGNGQAKKIAAQFVQEMRERFRNHASFGNGIFIDPSQVMTDDTKDAKQSGE
jgi:hypothetical protein